MRLTIITTIIPIVQTFKFLYLPNIEIRYEQYLPSSDGYRNSKLTFSSINNSYVLNENHEEIKQITIPKELDTFIGYYKYNEEEYKFKLQKSSHLTPCSPL